MRQIGRKRIQDRIAELNGQIKEGLAAMDHVTLHTPLDPELSAGIVTFDVEGHAPQEVARRCRGLQQRLDSRLQPRRGSERGDPQKSGEFEAFLDRVDPTLLARMREQHSKSKPRVGAAFAVAHPAPQEVLDLYRRIRQHIDTRMT
ncbi:hypothetical protein ABZX95_44155 [Streptomyces sp. NPDC004232]|uniref:hypothetical protein n=1 Tax=Streptomyces sp. NPDC004232 TaxID=3154454 RepID=UPI0033B63FDD